VSTEIRYGDCAKASELFSLSLDGELDPFQSRRLERHLGSCAACRWQTARLEAITSMLRAAPLEPAPAFVPPRSDWRRRLLRNGVPVAAALAALSLGLGLVQGSVSGSGGRTTPALTAFAVSKQAQITYAPQPQPQQPYANAVVVWAP
jgi:anti-sigma factor RsiW